MIRALSSVILSLCCLASVAAADSKTASPVEVSAIFPLGEELAAYEPDTKQIAFLALEGGKLVEKKRFRVPGNVWGIAKLPKGYAIATGLGRDDLEAPFRVQWFAPDGSASQPIFERTGERSQAAFLRYIDGKLWITFFESKYITKTGSFTQRPDASWDYKELTGIRMGDTVDVSGDFVAIGRPYGDVQGQDGDVQLFKGTDRTELPSYRGVRAVRFFGPASDPRIAIGDGWHQNYGQLAQCRLSLIKRDPTDGRYALEIIDHDQSQYGISRIIDFTIGNKTYLAALGNKTLAVYGPDGVWTKHVVYTRPAEDALYDVALLKVSGSEATFAVLDHGVKVVTFNE